MTSVVKMLIPFSWHSSFAKFRTGVAPLRLETGRYEKLAVNQRTCFNCHEIAEPELHLPLKCPLYEDLQLEMYSEAFYINPGFYSLNHFSVFLERHDKDCCQNQQRHFKQAESLFTQIICISYFICKP